MSINDRFWDKVDKTKSCWLWKAHTSSGYGKFRLGERTIYAHRFSYELVNGKIPSNLEIAHLCNIRNCVNPNHLEAVTHKENLHRSITLAAIESAKTHCSKGHVYDKVNTGYRKTGKRWCKICSNETNRQRYAFLKTQRQILEYINYIGVY